MSTAAPATPVSSPEVISPVISPVLTSTVSVTSISTSTGLTLKCDQCDNSNETEKGLSQHVRMKHRISQVDGVDDLPDVTEAVTQAVKLETKETQTDVFLKVDGWAEGCDEE